ncbi:thioesterase family protein [Burkholderia cenocepacia]|uniref:acyl-CoA thioesterase n=1 Tax=Burkholderia cenocepacia TaxID=95486 RepID=UPI002AAFF5BA|nr:thioesterase family protein [Burkholderia cenocepacia]
MNRHGETSFRRERIIRFHHCDPAGIVFYPQYLVMLHAFIEAWFDEGLELPYGHFIGQQRLGIPVVRLECEFFAPSRLGDHVEFTLAVGRLGNSSIEFVLAVNRVNREGVDEVRMTVKQTVVLMSLDTHRPVPLPASLRERMSRYLQQADTDCGGR